ncbi:MAG TPA: hypothetical protein VH370_26360 [Humisphaera sp.]|jgi:hypothetical protein|nr:hypothetical protein [Humisphaera sp.]
MYRARARAAVRYVKSQLLERSPTWEHWKAVDQACAPVAEQVSKIVADEIGWPNHHFLPEDPLEVVLFAPLGDGGEGLVIGDALDKLTGGVCDEPWVSKCRTFGEFVEHVQRALVNRK